MPALSWNEIRQRAIQFSREWKGEQNERPESQTFWNEFFWVFGIRRRAVAAFEVPVKSSLKNTYHRIDLFWEGTLLAEHKSAGANLDRAESQAFLYIRELIKAGREEEAPPYVILSDFNRLVLYNLEPEAREEGRIEFPLSDLHDYIKHFAFLIGQKPLKFGEQDEVNLKAAALMANLHICVANDNYPIEDLERLLVRLLFCLFAEDTGIFDRLQFELFIKKRTRDDASDLGPQLNTLFEVLNTPQDKRPRNLDEDLLAFPYVNGELFKGYLSTAGFTSTMRNQLLTACRFNWARISPAIFGSLFQGIMDAKKRRRIGAHYTSERDILKVIRPLFLDDLRAEFELIKRDIQTIQNRRKEYFQLTKDPKSKKYKDLSKKTNRLLEFQQKIANLRFLDPACGCGNFLVIAYRELRRLEHEVLNLLYNFDHEIHVFEQDERAKLSQVDVHQFYGIEIEEWPARIAETALWLTDHQMNTELSLATGNLFQRIPLRATPHILCDNALQFDWNEHLPASECSYVLGNPPFRGKKEQDRKQKEDHDLIWNGVKGSGILDYVTCWYVKAGQYTKGSRIRCAFVSTNSITQGEQPGVLWPTLYGELGLKIHFAHTTFAWQSEAKGAAHVHVVVIGFGPSEVNTKTIFFYSDIKGDPQAIPVQNINPYLADAPDVILTNRTSPLCAVPPINYGSMMIDKDRNAGSDQGLIIEEQEREILIKECPELESYIRKIYGGEEYINGTFRWCLWLVNAPADLLRSCERLRKRIEEVKNFRLRSGREATNALAVTPYLFGEIRQPSSTYLIIPKVSSETRSYIPIGFLPPEIIASGSALVVPKATNFEFGVISSAMHMAWVKTVCGRMKSDYQYSSNIVYNNYPWPMEASPVQREKVEECAGQVLETRQQYLDSGNTLADLYDPLYMPAPLLKAHQALDRAVDRCYRSKPFKSERERVEFLFQLYEQITSPLAPTASATPRRRGKTRKTEPAE